jgi:C4-dicarboxylate-specific signal transduction histidine kinase
MRAKLPPKKRDLNAFRALTESARMAALNDMASGIAHEINNPLAIILGRAQSMKLRLQKGAVDPNYLCEGLDRIEATVHRISSIISALRLVTRDGTNDSFAPTPVRSIISDIAHIWSERLLNNGIEFRVLNIPEGLSISCKSSQVCTALLNLVSNSFQAVKACKSGFVEISVEDLNDFVEIAVTDSGPGIPREIRDRIFNPFFTTRKVGEGAGLGLSVALGVAVDHGGSITLDDKSKNTRFILRLPKRTVLNLASAS